MDFFEDRRRGAQAQSRAAKFLGDENGEKTFLCQPLDEGGRIGALAVERAPVFAGKVAAEFGDRVANVGMVASALVVTRSMLPWRPAAAAPCDPS